MRLGFFGVMSYYDSYSICPKALGPGIQKPRLRLGWEYLNLQSGATSTWLLRTFLDVCVCVIVFLVAISKLLNTMIFNHKAVVDVLDQYTLSRPPP